MKVAIIIPRLTQLGPIKVVETLVNSLFGNEIITVKVFYLDRIVDPQIKMKVPVERLNLKTFCFRDYDIIHTNGIRPDLIASINRKKIKYHISTIHNLVFEDFRYTYNPLISLMLGYIWLFLWRGTNKLVCISDTMKKYYGKWYTLSKLEVIYNGIPNPDKSITPDSEVIMVINDFRSQGLKVIGCAGILTKRKGVDQVLKLMSIQKELALIIIGCGMEVANLKNLVKKLKITERCYFCGFKSDAVGYLKYLDYFIMPSRSEGFGLTLIEAVQQKVPVICSDISVFKELFTKDEVTFFKLENINSLSLALKEAIETASIKINLAFRRYEKCYTDQIMAGNYYRLYQSCS